MSTVSNFISLSRKLPFRLSDEAVTLAKAFSRGLGWTLVSLKQFALLGTELSLRFASFICLVLSFYPQVYSNYVERSLTVCHRFPDSKSLGFTAYSLSTAAFLWCTVVRSQYASRHPDSPEPTVRFNDWAFAVMLSFFAPSHFPVFFKGMGIKVGRRQKASKVVLGIVVGCLVRSSLHPIRLSLPTPPEGPDVLGDARCGKCNVARNQWPLKIKTILLSQYIT